MFHHRSARIATPTAIVLSAVLYGSLLTSPAQGQLDRVYTFGNNTATAGTVTETTKDGLKLKIGSNVRDFKADEIRKVSFQGDPAALTRARELALDGSYDQAIDELKTVTADSLKRDVIKAELAYYRLLSRSKLALAGQGDRQAAVNEALAFASTYRDSFHFFSVAKLLGDLELANRKHDKAIQYYDFLANAPSTESKIESQYLIGMVKLDKGDIEGAQAALARVASVDVNSTAGLRLKTLAKAGQAIALAKSGKGDEGLALADQLISELIETDIEMAARIYNAQGASYEAAGDLEGAILSYLHTHLMFSGQPDAHAQALSRLVELWPKVGRAERAATARQELQQRYPGFAK